MEIQPHLSVLKVSGDDALSFLQGQLTNDITVADKAWQLSAYCNPKGRALALFNLWTNNGSAYLILHKSLTESIVKRLRMYVMRSRVVIEIMEDASCVAINDCQTESVLGGLTLSEGYNELSYHRSRLRVYFEQAPEAKSGSSWSQTLIDTGVPQISAQTTELFVPQMINLDVLGGINFKKGCYTGQEIVARMHYLGKLKQRMYLLDIVSETDTSSSFMPGNKLISHEDKNLGTVVNRITDYNSVLAVLRVDESYQNLNDVTLSTNCGSILKLRDPQPYSLSVNR